MMFGLSQAIANALQITSAPAELVSALPYIMTILLVMLFALIRIGRRRRKMAKLAGAIQEE